jgi:hypothetical protein
VYCLFICLCCLFSISTVRRRRLQKSLGARCSRLWAAASRRARQVILDHVDPMSSLSFSSIHTLACMLWYCYLSLILRIWVHTWLVLFSKAVMSVVHVFPSFVILSLACAFVRDGLSSVEMWFDRGEDRCCGLSKVGMVETVEFCQVMWFVMLESAMDWILGVDPPRQYVSPRVQYGMACLLIRNTIGCVSCSVEWGWHHTLLLYFVTYFVNRLNHMVQEGTSMRDTLALQVGTVCSGNCSKAWHTLVVDLCNNM